jgi:hypothetical protein
MTLKNESVLTFDGLGKLVWFVIKGKEKFSCVLLKIIEPSRPYIFSYSITICYLYFENRGVTVWYQSLGRLC